MGVKSLTSLQGQKWSFWLQDLSEIVQSNLQTNLKGDMGRKCLGKERFLHSPSFEADMPCLLTRKRTGCREPGGAPPAQWEEPCGQCAYACEHPSHANPGQVGGGGVLLYSVIRGPRGAPGSAIFNTRPPCIPTSSRWGKNTETVCTWDVFMVRLGGGTHHLTCHWPEPSPKGHNSTARKAGK